MNINSFNYPTTANPFQNSMNTMDVNPFVNPQNVMPPMGGDIFPGKPRMPLEVNRSKKPSVFNWVTITLCVIALILIILIILIIAGILPSKSKNIVNDKASQTINGTLTARRFGTGQLFTYYGFGSGNDNTQAGANTYIGTNSGTNTTTGSNNTAVGSSSGNSITTGKNNTYIGYFSLW
jgi:hypothetical protein